MYSMLKRGIVCFIVVTLVVSFPITPSTGSVQSITKISSLFDESILSSSSLQSVLVVLKDEPVIEHEKKNSGTEQLNAFVIASDAKSAAYEQELLDKQNKVFKAIKEISPSAEFGYSLTWTLNGFTLRVRGSDLSKVASLDAIKQIELLPSFSPEQLSSLIQSQSTVAEAKTPTYAYVQDNLYSGLRIKDVWQMKDGKGNPLSGKGIVVAVIDTGVDYTHPDLGGCIGPSCKVIGGYDFGDNDNDPMDQVTHGTLVAGTIAANGAIKGVAPQASLLAYKVIPNITASTSTTEMFESVSNILPAIDRAVKDGANIINISMTEQKIIQTDYGKEIIDNLDSLGVIMVAAGGNNGSAQYCDEPLAPDVCPKGFSAPMMLTFAEPNVITVGGALAADTSTLTISGYSPMGPTTDFRLKPDLIAPSYSYNTVLHGSYDAAEGTSFSAPITAGIIALMKQAFPSWNPLALRAALVETTTVLTNADNNEPVTELLQGSGRVDALSPITTPILAIPYSISMTATNLKPVAITVKNVSNSDQFVSATVQLTLGNFELGANDGLSLSVSPTSFTIPRGDTATLTFIASVDFSKLTKGPHEATIWLSAGSTKIHIPVLIWNDPSSWWFPVSPTQPNKIGSTNISPAVLDFNAGQHTVTIGFTLKSGSMPPSTATKVVSSYVEDYVYLTTISILDQNDATVNTIYSQKMLLIGHYQASWNGLDENGLPVKNGKYKYVVASSDLGITKYGIENVNVDTATGYIDVVNSPNYTLPKIDLDIPDEFTTTAYVFETNPTFKLNGKTDIDSKVEVNGQSVKVDSTGGFTAQIPLMGGPNIVSITAHRTILGDIEITNHKQVIINLKPLNLIQLTVGKSQFKVNNHTKTLDAPPVIKNSRTLLPIRAVVEAMGGQVQWDSKAKRVDIQYRGNSISLWIGQNTARVNGKAVMIDPSNPKVVPEIINGRTMVPLRFVAETLGCSVEWLPDTKSIEITYPAD
jgi:minor extracellular serine protease Vpr